MSESERNSKRHVLISGGSRGLGRALVEGLLDADYAVSAFSRKATEFAASLNARDDAFFTTADMQDGASLSAMTDAACKKLGAPYALVNCAGVASDGVLASAAEEEIARVIDINLTGALRLTRLVVRRMLLERGGGAIVNISSIVGSRGYRGLAAYSAAKAGMDGMTRSLARELGDRRIRVNSIAPGYLETEMTHGLDNDQREQIVRRTPLGRLGVPQDVVGPTLFLLSDQASFITGQTLLVDGGIGV